MTVSLVGRMAIGRSSSLCPDLVTQATCAHTRIPSLPPLPMQAVQVSVAAPTERAGRQGDMHACCALLSAARCRGSLLLEQGTPAAQVPDKGAAACMGTHAHE
jgi:hypothetical protein